jgi:hypothetical protein
MVSSWEHARERPFSGSQSQSPRIATDEDGPRRTILSMTDSTPAFDPNAMDPEERAWESFVSPHFRRKDLGPVATPEQIIAVFADRVTGWQIDIADRLMKTEEHAGFAVLSIVASYFEMIGKHLEGFQGVGRSSYHFRKGFDSVFPEVDAAQRERISARIYQDVRNGMYHDAITVGGIALSRSTGDRVLYETPGVDGTVEIVLNPELLTSRIRTHFAAYVAALLADPTSSLRAAFLRRQGWAEAHPAAEEAPDAEESGSDSRLGSKDEAPDSLPLSAPGRSDSPGRTSEEG